MTTKRTFHDIGEHRERGISLLETAIAVAIVAIVGASALPSFTALVEGRRLEAAATRLAADIQFVRGEAIVRNRSLRLSVRTGADATCWIVHTGAPADCSCAAAGAVCTGEALAIKSVVLPDRERVGVAGNVASITFDPLHGTSTPTGTLRLTDARGRAVHHVVNVLGRVRSCSPEGAVPGYPTC
ncbi:MAG TPA: GspH/FimT family protein [Caldimonas sp.]|jgi:type IV fimbrial biogenesis protein FimT